MPCRLRSERSQVQILPGALPLLAPVTVYKMRPWTPEDAAAMGDALLRQLSGEFLADGAAEPGFGWAASAPSVCGWPEHDYEHAEREDAGEDEQAVADDAGCCSELSIDAMAPPCQAGVVSRVGSACVVNSRSRKGSGRRA